MGHAGADGSVPGESDWLRSVADEAAIDDVGCVVGDDRRRCGRERGLLVEGARLVEDVVGEEIAHGVALCDATGSADDEIQRWDDGGMHTFNFNTVF